MKQAPLNRNQKRQKEQELQKLKSAGYDLIAQRESHQHAIQQIDGAIRENNEKIVAVMNELNPAEK